MIVAVLLGAIGDVTLAVKGGGQPFANDGAHERAKKAAHARYGKKDAPSIPQACATNAPDQPDPDQSKPNQFKPTQTEPESVQTNRLSGSVKDDSIFSGEDQAGSVSGQVQPVNGKNPERLLNEASTSAMALTSVYGALRNSAGAPFHIGEASESLQTITAWLGNKKGPEILKMGCALWWAYKKSDHWPAALKPNVKALTNAFPKISEQYEKYYAGKKPPHQTINTLQKLYDMVGFKGKSVEVAEEKSDLEEII